MRARQAFRKYDADNSNSIDAEELRTVLADMNFFEGLDEGAQENLVMTALKEVDSNNDGQLSFSEFTTCYNKLKSKCEEKESAAIKLPSIFGEELSASEQLRVKAIPKMLDRSVFLPRKKEAASKDYFDTVAVGARSASHVSKPSTRPPVLGALTTTSSKNTRDVAKMPRE